MNTLVDRGIGDGVMRSSWGSEAGRACRHRRPVVRWRCWTITRLPASGLRATSIATTTRSSLSCRAISCSGRHVTVAWSVRRASSCCQSRSRIRGVAVAMRTCICRSSSRPARSNVFSSGSCSRASRPGRPAGGGGLAGRHGYCRSAAERRRGGCNPARRCDLIDRSCCTGHGYGFAKSQGKPNLGRF